MRRTLWLDTACEFNPAPGDPDVLTRAGWVEGTIDQWAKFAAPVAESMNDALASVISERLGGAFGDGEIAGMFAGPVADSDSRRYERPSPTDEAAGATRPLPCSWGMRPAI